MRGTLLAAALLAPCSVVAQDDSRSWKAGDAIPVECLNRTTEFGEHVTDAQGLFQYAPFPTCAETGRALELVFGSEAEIACTILLTDELFHLFEFYIHDDVPLSCRLPAVPVAAGPDPGDTEGSLVGGKEARPDEYTRLQIALTGTLQLSHLHINPSLNVVVHTTATSKAKKEGRLLAATAYSLPPTLHTPRHVVGDSLALRLSVRWFSERQLPPSTARLQGLGGHVHFSTVAYCLISFGAGVALSLAYWRGIELPRRLRQYGAERLGFGNDARGGYAFPGKRD